MARKATIDTDTMISLVGRFYTEKCDHNSTKLKIPEIAGYIRSQGYDIQDYIVRRNEKARSYIDKLKENSEEAYINEVSVYRDIDLDAFLKKNNTKEKLAKAIRERETYYMQLTSAATYSFKEIKSLRSRVTEQADTISNLKNELSAAETRTTSSETKYKKCLAENRQLRALIETYLYPEIANELLKKQGLLKDTAGMVDHEVIENTVVTADTDVSQIKNNVIKGLFDKV